MSWNNIARLILAFVLGVIVAGIALLATAISGVSPELTEAVDSYVSLGGPQAPSPPPGTFGEGGRIVIPAAGVDARIVTVGRDAGGVMQTPNSAWDVGWYDFTTPAGQPGNTVMAGHLDYRNVGPAVFWSLRDLVPGDEAQVQLREGGDIVQYQVTRVESYETSTAPVEAIIGPTEADVLTLITCDGSFNSAIGEYDRRLVVRAERGS